MHRIIGGFILASIAGIGAAGHSRLIPDTAIYLGDGGSWIYPSIGGHIVGISGYWGLAGFNILAAFGLGWLVVALAQRNGAKWWAAILLVVALPAGGYFIQPAAMDCAGAAFVLAAIYFRHSIFAAASMMFHPASTIGWITWRMANGSLAGIATAIILTLCGIIAVMMTPYAAILQNAGARGFLPMVATCAVVGIPLIALWKLGARFAPSDAKTCALWCAFSAAGIVFLQGGMQVRYFMPATALIATTVRWKSV